jgi:hypothetical protein
MCFHVKIKFWLGRKQKASLKVKWFVPKVMEADVVVIVW